MNFVTNKSIKQKCYPNSRATVGHSQKIVYAKNIRLGNMGIFLESGRGQTKKNNSPLSQYVWTGIGMT